MWRMRWNRPGKRGKNRWSNWNSPVALLLGRGGGAPENQVEDGKNKGNDPRGPIIQNSSQHPHNESGGEKHFQDMDKKGHRINLEHF